MGKVKKRSDTSEAVSHGYDDLLSSVVDLLEQARSTTARAVNAVMTATYWEIGRRIVVHEQGGQKRAGYGEGLLKRLAVDLSERLGRGFSERNLEQMRRFYLLWQISQTTSAELSDAAISQTASAELSDGGTAPPAATRLELPRFTLPWSHYVQLISVDNEYARRFYETEAHRGGWTVRQLRRQIDSQFYERTALSKNKAAMLAKGQKALAQDAVTPEEAIKDPLVLEFLGLKDEYSESDLEDALIRHLESFLLELGGDFAFVGRQKRLRIDDEWYRVDLVFFHRKLRCLVIIDLKLGKFTHADAGQMHVYLNYAKEQWTREGENPPVGILLCATKGHSLARYATEGLPNKMLVSQYLTALPDEKLLAEEIQKTRDQWERGRLQ
ncbi:MAG: PDDEXK nuclease domain-containing protein [Myxococcota bacterium]|jgi:predicted nuclease of restriction endonuclease-like (RecB) superfamily|nr:PDDEXK nuclease domain-containing protein [Myxococcota bacterium]